MSPAGPERRGADATPIDVAALGARAVLDLRMRSRLLGSLWHHQPAVIAWLRHFG